MNKEDGIDIHFQQLISTMIYEKGKFVLDMKI